MVDKMKSNLEKRVEKSGRGVWARQALLEEVKRAIPARSSCLDTG